MWPFQMDLILIVSREGFEILPALFGNGLDEFTPLKTASPALRRWGAYYAIPTHHK
jgi:hypothetical protein